MENSALCLAFTVLSPTSDFHDIEFLQSIIVFDDRYATYTLAPPPNVLFILYQKWPWFETRLEDFDKYEDLRIIQIDSVAFRNTLRYMLYQRRSRNGSMISNS